MDTSNLTPSQVETYPLHAYLPLEIVTNILHRLPARAVTKFRRVCKQWNSLISDRRFQSAHHMITRRIKFLEICRKEQKLYDLNAGVEEEGEARLSLQRVTFWRKHYAMSNFVNGLTYTFGFARKTVTPNLAFENLGNFILNPTTGEEFWLPESKTCRQGIFNQTFGLGVDISTEEYKVVRIFQTCPDDWTAHEVLTVGSSKWRYLGKADDFPVDSFLLNCPKRPLCLNGSLYWRIIKLRDEDGVGGDPSIILPFSLKDEKFESPITIPQSTNMDLWDIIELDGSLHIALIDDLRKEAEIWKLHDKKWARCYCFCAYFMNGCIGADIIGFAYDKLFIVAGTNKGPVLHYYDLRSKKCHEIVEGKGQWWGMGMHKESLISISRVLEENGLERQSRLPMRRRPEGYT